MGEFWNSVSYHWKADWSLSPALSKCEVCRFTSKDLVGSCVWAHHGPAEHLSAHAMIEDNFVVLTETGAVCKFGVGVLCMVIKSLREKKVISWKHSNTSKKEHFPSCWTVWIQTRLLRPPLELRVKKILLEKTTSVSITSSSFASDTEFLGASQGVLGVLHYVVRWCKILLLWQESCWAVFWRACSLSIKDLCFWAAALLCTGKVIFHITKL